MIELADILAQCSSWNIKQVSVLYVDRGKKKRNLLQSFFRLRHWVLRHKMGSPSSMRIFSLNLLEKPKTHKFLQAEGKAELVYDL